MKTAVLRSVSHDLRSPITAIVTASECSKLGRRPVAGRARRSSIGRSGSRPAPRPSRRRTCSTSPARGRRRGPGAGALARGRPGRPRARRARVPSRPRDAVAAGGFAARPRRRGQLERALVNLLENALSSRPESDRVELTLESTDGDVVVRVLDHGPGIPASRRERVFQPFAERRVTSAAAPVSGWRSRAASFSSTAAGSGSSRAAAAPTFALALPAAALRPRWPHERRPRPRRRRRAADPARAARSSFALRVLPSIPQRRPRTR